MNKNQAPAPDGALLRPPTHRRTRRLANFLVVTGAVLLLIFAGYRSDPLPYVPRYHARKIGNVEWSPASECPSGTECGSVLVPKDYFDASAGTASIAIARFRATKLPKKGTVFLNPGGPGGSGTTLAAKFIAEMIGEDWDLLGFDPRGIGKTSPLVKCLDSSTDYAFFTANTVLQQGFTVRSSSNLSDPLLEEQLVEQSRQFLALKKAQAEVCAHSMGDELRYMGTATVVRDMDFMSKIFDGEDGKINYWGGSYGSILGAYLVNMLPSRAGFVAIDAIVDPVNWSTEPSHKWPINWLASAEKTYRFFLETCSHAGPAACALAEYTDEPYEDIEARIESFFDRLAREPLPVPYGYRPGFLTSGAARALMLNALEGPATWAVFADAFAQAMAGNGTLLFNKLEPHPLPPHPNDHARLAVTCLDSPPPASPADVPTPQDLAAEFLKTMREVSPHFGASISLGEPDGGCQYWHARGPERFTGPWNAILEWPMLVVSNTMDPITPIESGLRINSLMPNSTRLIIQDGPGHGALAIPTPCTLKLVRGYFAGNLPDNGTTCETAYNYFPGPAGADSEPALSALDVEDRKLVEAARAVAGILRGIRQG
ncbi:Alpha/Beta hydrolase protein [Mycena latifolia]|nr:Alpha/Beta hydrolase protein [Mycena latifolia]